MKWDSSKWQVKVISVLVYVFILIVIFYRLEDLNMLYKFGLMSLYSMFSFYLIFLEPEIWTYKEMKILWLDDIRNPFEGRFKVFLHPGQSLDWVKTYDEFVEYIEKNGVPNIISFDHDLADEHYKDLMQQINAEAPQIDLKYGEYIERTGYDCLKWLVTYCDDNDLELPHCKFHTQNPIGEENMRSYYENARKHLF